MIKIKSLYKASNIVQDNNVAAGALKSIWQYGFCHAATRHQGTIRLQGSFYKEVPNVI